MITIDDTISNADLPDLTFHEILQMLTDSRTTTILTNETIRRLAIMSVNLLDRLNDFKCEGGEKTYDRLQEASYRFYRPINYHTL